MQSKGIEVGHIFSFGTKYSEAMKANVLNKEGKQINVYMGSYGIGVSRLVGAIIESSHDENGIIWPESIAPFDVGLINLKPKDAEISKAVDKIYESLKFNSLEILYDDKFDNAGVKFSRMDLIGIPFQIIVGNQVISDNQVEIKNRKTGNIENISLEALSSYFKKKHI